MSGHPPEAAVLHVLRASIHGQGAPSLDPHYLRNPLRDSLDDHGNTSTL